MTAIDNTPSNRNFLSPLNFQFSIKRAPNVNFFLQKVNIPSLSLGSINIPTQFVPIPSQFSHVKFGEFNIEFKVDEDFQNYMELYNWIIALGFPDNYSQRAAIDANPNYTGLGDVSDISLIALNSAKNPNYEIVFQDAFPTQLGDVVFDSTNIDVQYITCSATFIYTEYTISRII
jgi:hypothetical protein